ncbi:MAG: NAD-glutamate dehydrogenase [Gammaproteobacteria bacterium]|nr:NAD-glutamate dehydrogenase [Gammaproteobacteria bacterium]
MRRDRYGLFYTCLVYMPRELFNTHLRVRIQALLKETLGAEDAPFDAYFSESILVRLQFAVRVPPGVRSAAIDVDDLQHRIIALTRDWTQDLREALVSEYGEADARRLAERYVEAFPAGYRDSLVARAAVADIADMESLSDSARINLRLHRSPEEADNVVHLKVFHKGSALPLSDILPVLENMGVRVVAENPFLITALDRVVSIHDYRLELRQELDLVDVGDRFERAFIQTWNAVNDNDTFNRLILSARLDWREATVLRAYARYMKQIRFGFSQEFIADTLSAHPAIAGKLVAYFLARFAPSGTGDAGKDIREQILTLLDGVALLNEDRILRRFVELIDATLRTNYFQRGADGQPKPQLCFKFAATKISAMPAPVPKFEIFVFSPRVEGVHLRGGPIARGGLRWSDRHEDYRTEVLGLVKAQVVKNAVIVPTGAKGGFVVRRPPAEREAFQKEGVACYRQFISGLLDVSDNIVAGALVPPPDVRRYDEDDPYLVVAADKGTATFSDIANEMSLQYEFWMDDAFASGGSNGYDHKKMGITAKGAWISVQRHFAEKSIDVQTDPITIVGIGDMSGDVFGNGLLLSESAQLVAAFNHLHVFIDPDPDVAKSFAERTRMFALPRSSWGDYDASILSAGAASTRARRSPSR